MGDLETQLRTEVIQRAREFSPSADLGDRIDARVRRRRRQRRLVAGVLSTVVMAVVALGVILARPANEDSMRIGDDGETPPTTVSTTVGTTTSSHATSTTTGPSASTTSLPVTTSTTPPASGPAPGPSIGAETPLSRSGIGPIRAGMTLRQAQAAAAVTITPGPSMGPGSTCITAQVEGLDLWFLVELSGQSGEDPMDGVIGSVQGGRRTVEGVAVGDPIANVDEIYGSPTRTLDYPYLPSGQVFVYESGAFAYSVTTDGDTVTELESGDPSWVANLEGCA